MGQLALSTQLIEKYFKFLFQFDRPTRQNLAERLSKTLEIDSKKERDLSHFFGAWKDDRDSDQIIQEIRLSRVDKNMGPHFE